MSQVKPSDFLLMPEVFGDKMTYNIAANLIEKRITLMASDMDEAPMAYKDIHTVIAAQTDLVECWPALSQGLCGWQTRGKGRRIRGRIL